MFLDDRIDSIAVQFVDDIASSSIALAQ